MSIINEALKKTQNNFDNIKEKVIPPANDGVSSGQKTWQQPAPQPSAAFRPIPPSQPPEVTPVPQAASTSFPKKPAGKRWFFIIIAEILALGLIAWILFIIQPQMFRSSLQAKMSSLAGKRIARTQQPNPVAPPAQPVPAASAATETRLPGWASARNNLILNGIMMDQNKMVALINGEIYETGDLIDGKEIKKITLERVELTDGEKVTTLSVRNQGQ